MTVKCCSCLRASASLNFLSALSYTHHALQVVLQLYDNKSQLDMQLSRLGSRAMQVAAAAAAGGIGGGAAGGLGGLSSPLTAVPPGSAMAGALMMSFPRLGEAQGLLASGETVGGPGGSGGSGRGALLRDDIGGGSGNAARGGPGGSLGGGTSSTVGLLGLGPLLGRAGGARPPPRPPGGGAGGGGGPFGM
jgi:hypothetical protein